MARFYESIVYIITIFIVVPIRIVKNVPAEYNISYSIPVFRLTS